MIFFPNYFQLSKAKSLSNKLCGISLVLLGACQRRFQVSASIIRFPKYCINEAGFVLFITLKTNIAELITVAQPNKAPSDNNPSLRGKKSANFNS